MTTQNWPSCIFAIESFYVPTEIQEYFADPNERYCSNSATYRLQRKSVFYVLNQDAENMLSDGDDRLSNRQIRSALLQDLRQKFLMHFNLSEEDIKKIDAIHQKYQIPLPTPDGETLEYDKATSFIEGKIGAVSRTTCQGCPYRIFP